MSEHDQHGPEQTGPQTGPQTGQQNVQQGRQEDEALLMAFDELADAVGSGADVEAESGAEQSDGDDGADADQDPWDAIASQTGRAADAAATNPAQVREEAEQERQRRRDRWAELRRQRREQQTAQRENTQSAPGQDGTQQPASTPLAPYRDRRVSEEAAKDGPPEWLGTRWREIPEEQQPQAWVGLRKWVDWLVVEYHLPEQVVPPCWYRHTDITAELWAAMNMEYKVWEEGAPSLSPMMMWHPNLEQMIARLRDKVSTAGCANGDGHKPPQNLREGMGPWELAYDEDDWAAVVAGQRTRREFNRGEQAQWVRASVFDAEGTHLSASAPLGIGTRRRRRESAARSEFSTLGGIDEVEVAVQVENAPEEHRLQWETSTDGVSWQPLADEDDAGGVEDDDDDDAAEAAQVRSG